LSSTSGGLGSKTTSNYKLTDYGLHNLTFDVTITGNSKSTYTLTAATIPNTTAKSMVIDYVLYDNAVGNGITGQMFIIHNGTTLRNVEYSTDLLVQSGVLYDNWEGAKSNISIVGGNIVITYTFSDSRGNFSIDVTSEMSVRLLMM